MCGGDIFFIDVDFEEVGALEDGVEHASVDDIFEFADIFFVAIWVDGCEIGGIFAGFLG